MENNQSSTHCPDERMAVLVESMRASDTAARQALSDALEIWPRDHRLWFMRGAVRAGSQDYDAARSDFDTSRQLMPDFPIASFMLGFLHLTHGHVDRAIDAWQPLDTLAEDNTLRVLKTGLLNLADDRFDQAIEQLHAGMASNRKYPLINRYIADVLTQVESIARSAAANHASSEHTGMMPETAPAAPTSR